MKRFYALGLVALALTVAGCVQLDSTAVINADGSGTLDITYSTSLEVEQALKELSTMDSGMDEDMNMPPLFDENFDIAAMKADLKPYGVTIKDFVQSAENGNRVVRLSLTFTGADGMQAALEMATGGDGTMGLRVLPDGNYYLGEVVASHDFESDAEAEPEATPDMPDTEDMAAMMQNAARSMELMSVLMKRADEMSVAWHITVPGDIIRHNAKKAEGRTCTWELDSSGMMSGDTPTPEIVFSSAGLKIDAPKR